MRAKSKGRLFGIAILLASFASANAGQGTASDGGGIVEYGHSDQLILAARDNAHKTLDQFLNEVLDKNGWLTIEAGVKVAMPVGDGTTEVIWVTPFSRANDEFTGVLANQPINFKGQTGDQIDFTRDQVQDWYLVGTDGKMYGNFTTRVMLDDLTAQQAATIKGLLSPTPLPIGW